MKDVDLYPAEDEEDEGEHEAGVVAEDGIAFGVHRIVVPLVRPSAVGSENNHGSLKW